MTDLIVPRTILAQLGGESFVMTCRATGFIGSADSLAFKLGRNPKRVTHVCVTLTPDGLYNITFFTTGKGPQSHDGIHPEMLQEVFGAHTGLYEALRAAVQDEEQRQNRSRASLTRSTAQVFDPLHGVPLE